MSSLLSELQALEIELHQPSVRCSREQLERLLHPDFREVGRSGRFYTRQLIIDRLTPAEVHPVVESGEFSVSELGQNAALLTYRSAHVQIDGSLSHHSLRSSIWVRAAQSWLMIHHQGTAAASVW